MNKMQKAIFAAIALTGAILGQNSAGAASLNMVTTGATSQPIGHHEFCLRLPQECQAIPGVTGAPAQLTRQAWADMLHVNATVNRTIIPLTDQEIYGVEEYWDFPTSVGDCEDYALLKRRMLMERGFSAEHLLITVVLQPDGSGHAVLTVTTDHGDFILDNMRERVMLWSDTEYTYLKRQAGNHAGRWNKIDDNRNPMAVGAVR
jgi:predicted transglutaminase-like cysteine proteinase